MHIMYSCINMLHGTKSPRGWQGHPEYRMTLPRLNVYNGMILVRGVIIIVEV